MRRAAITATALAALSLAVAVALPSGAGAGEPSSLEAGFRAPPPSARPYTWYHLMNGNVTREGITRDFEALVADARYKYISKYFAPVLSKKQAKFSMTKSDKIDKVLTHKVWGIPIFLVILFLVFHLTFSEDFLYLGAAGVFDKEVVAYTATQEIVSEEDFVPGGIYFDEDGNEVEAVFYEGEFVELAPVPYAYDKKRNKIEAFYDKDGNELESLADEEGELLDLYDANGVKYETFYNADGYECSLVLDEETGKFADVEFVSEIDAFCSEITINTFFGYEESIYSPGVILFNALDTFTGLLSACASEAMADAPAWASGLVVDGILGGLFSVLSFLPQILLLFLFFSLLEDSGYMARVAFILDRMFRRFGLSGRAFMPMIMGFGCSIPAMTNTRTLADAKERTATIRVIPFFSCSAKLPILTAIAGGIVQRFGMGNADLITYAMYLLGIVVAIASVIIMRSTTMKGEVPPFIMELPTYHIPQAKALMIHLFDKAKHFIKKAFTIILASTIVIWFVSHFSRNWQYLEDSEMNLSILAGLGGLLQPLFTPLGFGSQLGAFGWVFVVAAVTGLIAKENVIATFGTLAACITAGFEANEALGGVDSVVQMIAATGIKIPALIAFIAFNMTTIPCFAAVATAKAELPDKKSFRMTLLFWVATSYIVASMIYLIGSWWWTAFIWAALIACAVVGIVLYNKKSRVDLKKAA